MLKTRTGVWTPPTLDFEEVWATDDMVAKRNLLRYWWTWFVIEQAEPPIRLAFDIGCGSGYGSRIMAEQHKDLVVCGIDDNEVALEIARQDYLIEGRTDYRRVNLDVSWIGHFYNARPQLVAAFDVFEKLLHRDAFLLFLTQFMHLEGLLLLAPSGDWWESSTTRLFAGSEPNRVSYAHEDVLDLLGRFFREVYTPSHPNFPGRDFLEQFWNAAKVSPRQGGGLIACRGPIRKGPT